MTLATATMEQRVVALAEAVGTDYATMRGRLLDVERMLASVTREAGSAARTDRLVATLSSLRANDTGAPTITPIASIPAALGRYGLSRDTGVLITGWAHVCQSIRDILTTRVGVRVMRRDYGSDLPKLIDAPMDASNILAVYVAVAEALAKWEPRFRLTRVRFEGDVGAGRLDLVLTGKYLPRGHLGDPTPASGDVTYSLPRSLLRTYAQAA